MLNASSNVFQQYLFMITNQSYSELGLNTTINVTEAFLPPIEDYLKYLNRIWESKRLTNNGHLVVEFENRISSVNNLSDKVTCVSNATIGLQIALKALGVSGEVITTPFSYVATASSALWNGCNLRFADIDSDNLTIDPSAIENLITPKTEAILATHVFGNPCDVEKIEQIGEKYGLAVIYDAAHAFGVLFKGRSLLEWGNVSVVSMHATKVSHSIEGGFLVCKDSAIREKIDWMKCFGHDGPERFHGIGINGKMSEFHAAMGLCVLDHQSEINERRKFISDAYDMYLGPMVSKPSRRDFASNNYSYYPVLFESEEILQRAMRALEGKNVFARRYFYPSLDTVGSFGTHEPCPISRDISSRILCLPLSASMGKIDVEIISSTLMDSDGVN